MINVKRASGNLTKLTTLCSIEKYLDLGQFKRAEPTVEAAVTAAGAAAATILPAKLPALHELVILI